MSRVRAVVFVAVAVVFAVPLVGAGVAAGASGNPPAVFASDDGDEWIG